MAQHGNYTTQSLHVIKDVGILLNVEARRWELVTHLRHLINDGKEPSGYTEGKAREFDRIYAEAERRGLK